MPHASAEARRRFLKDYYLKNKERLSEQQKRRYRLNIRNIREANRKYREAHKEEIAEREKQRRKENKEAYREKYLQKTYGLSVSEYDNMVREQNQRCQICGLVSRLFVDHDHETNKVRGLLCSNCNFAIGLLQEEPEILKNALDYLARYRDK